LFLVKKYKTKVVEERPRVERKELKGAEIQSNPREEIQSKYDNRK
jgi:hypothetical protein